MRESVSEAVRDAQHASLIDVGSLNIGLEQSNLVHVLVVVAVRVHILDALEAFASMPHRLDHELRDGFEDGCGDAGERKEDKHDDFGGRGHGLTKIREGRLHGTEDGFEDDGCGPFRAFSEAEGAKIGALGRDAIVARTHEIYVFDAFVAHLDVAFDEEDAHACG